MIILAVLLVIAAVFVALWGFGKTILALAKGRPRNVYRGLALICGSIAVGGYALGVSLVGLAQGDASHGTDSSPAPACRQAAPAKAQHVTGHHAGYFPPRFDCNLDDGTTYSAGVVPTDLMPVVLIAALATVAATSAGARSRRGAANDRYKGSAPE